MAPTAPVQREPVSVLVVVTVGLMALRPVVWLTLGLRLRLPAASDERRQAINIAVVVSARSRGAMLRTPAIMLLWFAGVFALLVLLVFALLITLLFAWRKELGVARQVGLRIARSEGGLLAGADDRLPRRFVLAIVEVVVAGIGRSTAAFRPIAEGLGLTELVLCRRDQTKIMLRVLEIVFRRHWVAG